MKSRPTLKFLLSIYFLIALLFTAISQTVTDYDGNVYPTETIGDQTWMAENLRVIHYTNGTSINDGSSFTFYPFDIAMDGSDSTRYYFYQDNDTSNAIPYGCLYNWFAAVNGNFTSYSIPSRVQGICPSGWHIPSTTEWEMLKNNVGDNSAEKLLIGGSSGFNAQYGGTRHDLENVFQGFGTSGSYISINVGPDGYITLFMLHIDYEEALFGYHRKTTGYSVRCIKDSQSTLINKENQRKVVFYPNPCKDNLYIDSHGIEIEKATLYSLNGVEIKSLILKGGNKGISVSEIDKGLYIIKICFDNFVYSDKVIIE